MKKILKALLLILITVLFIPGCEKAKPKDYNKAALDPELLHACTDQLTDVIVFDIFKPPVASRIYVYSYLAAYETLQQQNEKYPSFSGKLKGLDSIPEPDKGVEYCFPLASLKAFVTVGKALTFSKDLWDNFEKDFFAKYTEMGVPEDVFKRSSEYGEKVANRILAYSGKDSYKTTRGYRHTLGQKQGCWVPTPPNYAEACEPQWNKIRLFTLDSCSQFQPPVPASYDMKENSAFYKLAKEVYDINQNMTDEQKAIAYFWDDNPMVTNIKGHASFAEKKMTPPGHWIMITMSVSKKEKQSMMQALETYALTSIALFDGFVGCWDMKYKTDRIRPVTVINNTFDNKWLPFLETPPFPEYTSGHSTISAAAGRILTHVFGKDYAFTDSTEYQYGHGVRSFTSFEQAYWETSMSRMYGGIHYRDGIEQGTYHGEKIGEWVWTKLKAPEGQIEDKLATSAEVETTPLKAEAK
jgi:hypothetical protein